MKKKRYYKERRSLVMGVIVFLILVSGTYIAAADRPSGQAKLAPAKVDSSELKPGLAVLYFHGFKARHLDKLPSGDQAVKKGKPGDPIPYLNHAFGRKHVFGSGTRKEIGMHMTGFLKLSAPGTYWFKAYANDGIRVFINDQLVADDPAWRPPPGDQYSEPLSINVTESGWFPVLIRYFQRKGTATLKLYWKIPGDKDFSIIPAEAYAHVPSPVGPKQRAQSP